MGHPVIRSIVAAAALFSALPAQADELSEARARVLTYELMRDARVDLLPPGFPASTVLSFKLGETDRFLADVEKVPAAEVKKWLVQRTAEYDKFDSSKYPSGIRTDVERVFRAQRDTMRRAAGLPDDEAKKLYLDEAKKTQASLKKEILRMQVRTELPTAIAATDRVFADMGDKIKDPWISLDTLENAAINANATILQAKALIAAIDAKEITDPDVRDVQKLKTDLEAAIKRNEERIGTLRTTYIARHKAIQRQNEGPRLEPAGPPMRPGKYTSVRAMAAGEGAGFARGPLNGYGRIYGPQHLGTIVDFGMRSGAFYENSALTTFELHESWKRQRDYEDRYRDWEKNGKKDWERYQDEKWKREQDWKMRDWRIRGLLGLPLGSTLGAAPRTIDGAPGVAGSNTDRFASTTGATAGAPAATDVAKSAGFRRDSTL